MRGAVQQRVLRGLQRHNHGRRPVAFAQSRDRRRADLLRSGQHGGGLLPGLRGGDAELPRAHEGVPCGRQGEAGQQRAGDGQHDLGAAEPPPPLRGGRAGQGLGRGARQQRAPEAHPGERGGGQGPAHAAGAHLRDRPGIPLAGRQRLPRLLAALRRGLGVLDHHGGDGERGQRLRHACLRGLRGDAGS